MLRLGHCFILSKFTNSPWYSGSSLVQIVFIASMRSRASLCRVAKTVPWFSISSWFQPLPTPNRKRPFESWSIDETSLAVTIGSRWVSRAMPVPTFSVVVTVAAVFSTRNGSMIS